MATGPARSSGARRPWPSPPRIRWPASSSATPTPPGGIPRRPSGITGSSASSSAHSPKIYDRHHAQFSAETGRDLDEALALARQDLELRHDVQGYDTLAWVCSKKGMQPEAEAAIARALARGTRRATFFYHAGMIARAADDPARARTYFTEARSINPHSVPLRWLRWLETQPDPASPEGPVPASGAKSPD